MNLGLVGHQLPERAAEPDRLRRELPAPAVALVEDQVDDREHRREPVRQQVGRRHAERDPGVLDLPLRAYEPLCHRRLRHEERARDLGRLEPAERPQGQRDLGVEGERRVAAGEDQLEPLVGNDCQFHLVLRRFGHVEQSGLRRERAVAADPVDRAVSRGRHEPGAWVVRRPVARPARRGDREGLLGCLLGEVEVAEEADQGRDDPPPFVAEDPVECVYHASIGRISIAPPIRPAGIRAASSIAASRSSPRRRDSRRALPSPRRTARRS